jgi:hypothetical protein
VCTSIRLPFIIITRRKLLAATATSASIQRAADAGGAPLPLTREAFLRLKKSFFHCNFIQKDGSSFEARA